MKIFLAADHAGFQLKEHLKQFLTSKNYEVEDCGAFSFNKDDDYPDFVAKAAEKVSENPDSVGILACGTGEGEIMVANRFKHVRCALFSGPVKATESVDITGRTSTDPFEIVKLTRDHNDANMLALSARFMDTQTAEKAVEVFLATPFSNQERHKRRVEKIDHV